MRRSIPRFLELVALVFAASTFAACSGKTPEATESSPTGGTGGTGGTGFGGNSFNQCGVAAPLPADTGQCTAVTAPTIADFDDYVGTRGQRATPTTVNASAAR